VAPAAASHRAAPPRPAAPAAATRPAAAGASRQPSAADGGEEARHLHLLGVLPPDVLARARRLRLPAGSWLFRQGDAADAMYIVERGRVEVVAEPPGLDAEVLRELGSGGIVGELALISGVPRTASLRARRDSTLLCLAREDFEALLELNPAFTRLLLRRRAGPRRRIGRRALLGRSG
jgi:NTE family protein